MINLLTISDYSLYIEMKLELILLHSLFGGKINKKIFILYTLVNLKMTKKQLPI